MSKKAALFLDIDGCLISSDGSVCCDYYYANAKIAELIRLGNIGQAPSVRLCSNRDINSVEMMSNFFGIVNSWQIVEGGAALYNPTTHEVKLNPAITLRAKKLFRWLKAKKLPAILKRFSCLQEYLGWMICIGMEMKPGSVVDAEAVSDFLKGKKREKNPQRKKGLLTNLIGKKLLRVEQYGNFIDIIPAGVSKGSGAKFLAEIDDIDLAKSVAVGDSEIDFSLFRQVRLIGCPSNATPACIEFVKSRRGKVSMHPYSKGILDVINWYLEK
jgi:hydroxymethylpyrimidine pyrophosphatase-like HAD family hydrolase